MTQFHNAREIPEARVSQLREKLAIWGQLRAEVQAARLRIRAELVPLQKTRHASIESTFIEAGR